MQHNMEEKQKHIFLVTQPDGTKTAHSAIQSFLEHPKGIKVSKQAWYENINKEKKYPFEYKGIIVEKVPIFTTEQSRIADFESMVL